MGKSKSKSGRPKTKKKYTDPNRANRLQKSAKPQSVGTEKNPFEVRVNKQKHINLGRLGKNERGLPGVSRGKAIEKRKATLLQEYKARNKSNVLLDKRIGEKSKEMPEDEKIVRRSALEKARQYKKKSIFSLQDDDEILTHKGQALVNIDRYDDPREESDSEDERLNEEFVSDANFSGFMRMKKKEEGIEDEFEGKSRQEIIAELIQNSKQRKFEKAKESDELFELREKLDQDFKDPNFRNLLMGVALPKKEEAVKPKVLAADDYDRLVKELQSETRTGCASNRQKTEEEIEAEEKEQLEKLERERIMRMRMTSNEETEHKSADDLNDGFDLDEDRSTLAYNIDGTIRSNKRVNNDLSASFDCFSNNKNDDEEDDEENDDEEEDESFSESNDEEEASSKTKGSKKKKPEKVKSKSSNCLKDKEIVIQTDIPFVILLPETYSSFVKVLKTYGANVKERNTHNSLSNLKVLLERIFKYNKAANKSKMWMLFCHVLRYSFDTVFHWKKFSNDMIELCKISVSYLHSIIVLDPNHCCEEFYKVLDSARSLFNDNNEVNYPMIFLLQFCPLLFYRTDFRHQIVTPAKIMLSQFLSEYRVTDFESAAKLTYLCSVALEFYQDSKRFSSEPLSALNSLLLCYSSNASLLMRIIPTIRPVYNVLHISSEDVQTQKVNSLNEVILKNDNENDDVNNSVDKLSILSNVIDLTSKFLVLYESLPSAIEIAYPLKLSLEDLLNREWPTEISSKLESTLSIIGSLKSDKKSLKVSDQKPKPLKLYEPLIEENFDGMKRRKGDKKKNEQSRLQYKIKQETRSAVREIKLDNTFLAKQQLKETMYKDAERKRKVKELMGSLANQEGDYQKIKRGKSS